MASITIDIQDGQLQQLKDPASSRGLSPEALLRANLEDWLSSTESDFSQAADYVLKKNDELYRRLG